ncbi:MAG: metallophosphoesterase [Archaeoglobi archaeon]|nr:metallophosphoesterase [Candidatus Mnemosynella bozhongmuii]
MRIAHISDLHISSRDFVKKCGENLLRLLDSIKPDLVIVTGDLTDQGYMHEYERAEEFLNEIKAEKLIVPGNHDSRNSGDILFEDFFGTRFPVYENREIIVLGIDSSEPDIDDGHVGRENYPRVTEIEGLEKIKVVAMHHHLIPIPGTGRERNIPVDSGDFLKVCTESEINLILSGHKHIPWVWKLENTHLITAGTATTRRLKGKSTQSFNLLEIEDGRILLRELRVLNGEVIEERRLM